MDRNHHLGITTTLMSPPEATPLHIFPDTASKMVQIKAAYNARFPMSPPVSPETKNGRPDQPASQILADPILYPAQDSQTQATHRPLFEADLSTETQRVVGGHVAARKASMFREASPPKTSEYELALEFKSRVAKSFNNNRRLWFRRELAYLMEDKQLKSGVRRYTNIAPALAPKHAVKPSAKISGAGGRRNNGGVVKPSPVRQTTPNPSGPKAAREDKDFAALPDYCPPVTSLPNKPNSLKVDWKGSPIDLSGDPHVHLLHPDEVFLAEHLRLDCATYLTSKRRIFISRIAALRIGKEFRKTDAQQACKIDVNKASKLWQAFEKVGWLNPQWVRQYE